MFCKPEGNGPQVPPENELAMCIGDAHRQFVLQQHLGAVPLWFAEHTAFLAVAVAGLHAAEIRSVCGALAGVAAEAALGGDCLCRT